MKIESLPSLTADGKKILRELRERLRMHRGDRLVRFMHCGSKVPGDCDSGSDIGVAHTVEGLKRKLKDEMYILVGEVEAEHLYPIGAIAASVR